MKQNKKAKWFVDERQELKNLQNANVVWTITLVLLGAAVWIQSFILHKDLEVYLPEMIILFVGCITQIILNIKDGVLYTKQSANRTFVWALYIGTSVVCGTVVGVMSHIRYDSVWYASVAAGAIMAASMFCAIIILDLISAAFTKRRIAKLEQKLDQEEEL